MVYCISIRLSLRSGRTVFYLVSIFIMGRPSRCSGCKTPHSEHTFGKLGKCCTGPDQGSDVEENTAPPLECLPVDDVKDLAIEDTLASLLGAVKSLTLDYRRSRLTISNCTSYLRTSHRQTNPVRFPFQMYALVARLFQGLLCRSCAP